jgi:rRNA-processing protein FCF1
MTIPLWISQKSRLLIDSNLLVGIVIGRARESLLGRKPVENFQRSDFDRLTEFVALFKSILTTPFVLAEVNSLINKTGYARMECRAALASQIMLMEEMRHSSRELSNDPTFMECGLTDISIKTAAMEDTLVLTEDEELLGILIQAGIAALRYKDLINAE